MLNPSRTAAGSVKLADRYHWMLCEAWSVRAPARCRITPERVAAAKAALSDRIATRARFLGAGDTTVRKVVRRMVGKLRARGIEVARVKVPDGCLGSHYIVLADGRHIRIADHYATVEAGKPLGGYSARLGHRHRLAGRSIVVRGGLADGRIEFRRDY